MRQQCVWGRFLDTVGRMGYHVTGLRSLRGYNYEALRRCDLLELKL